jgi:GntR family transcriptional regulator
MEFREKQAIYLQIAEYLSEQVLRGRFGPGDRVPAVRELASELQVNPNTVMRTFEFLQQKEIIQPQRGIGYFVTADAPARITAWQREQFLDTELPLLFRKMTLLGIDLADLETRFEAFKLNV